MTYSSSQSNENQITDSSSSVSTPQKDFRDLSTAEIEQLMTKGVASAKKRMHNKGIDTVSFVDGNIYYCSNV